jgi:hypothetical protein
MIAVHKFSSQCTPKGLSFASKALSYSPVVHFSYQPFTLENGVKNKQDK